MKYVVHTADSRGNAEHGWLHSRHKGFHSEYNASDMEPLQFFLSTGGRNTEFHIAVVPDGSPETGDGALRINQDAWVSFADFTAGRKETYKVKTRGNCAYEFVIEGQIEVSGESLGPRGIGIVETE